MSKVRRHWNNAMPMFLQLRQYNSLLRRHVEARHTTLVVDDKCDICKRLLSKIERFEGFYKNEVERK